MKKIVSLVLLAGLSQASLAADYTIDGSGAGMHSAVQFKVSHVGISALWGRFNDITGSFSYDKDDLASSSIQVNIDPASLDSNHAARDEHLRSADYLNVAAYPEAGFVSSSIEETGDGTFLVHGDFTLHGVTRPLTIEARRSGEGETPFGDYRVGFEGSASFDAKDYGINILPSSQIELILAIEGIRQ